MGGGSFVLEIQTGWGSCASGNPGERGGLKNNPIRRRGADFFWNNPFDKKCLCVVTVILRTLLHCIRKKG